ncbi:MAG: hypothetical protein WKF84_03295 [Pyrinomonadaceae bacterium]
MIAASTGCGGGRFASGLAEPEAIYEELHLRICARWKNCSTVSRGGRVAQFPGGLRVERRRGTIRFLFGQVD